MKDTLYFTVDLQTLFKESIILLNKNAAGYGLILGFQVGLSHLIEIGKIAMANHDIPILLRLFALGIIENPVPKYKEEGIWDEKYNELAQKLGAS